MIELAIKKNVILGCHITGIYDVNRSTTLPDNDYGLISDWCESIINHNLTAIIFHNGFSENTCKKYSTDLLQFVRINFDLRFNPNVYRYIVYSDFLAKHQSKIENLFCTDVSDVVLVKNPFIEPFYLSKKNFIFCGDEPKQLDNDWMNEHSEHMRNKISEYANYEHQFGTKALLNCGVVGGNIDTMKRFIDQLALIHKTYNFDNKTAYTGDMGAFNFLARTQYNHRLVHGFPVNTVFKEYQDARTDCWFKHK
jgi:hypothetical protein